MVLCPVLLSARQYCLCILDFLDAGSSQVKPKERVLDPNAAMLFRNLKPILLAIDLETDLLG